ncbi:Ankyrin [Carabus blaptoides fortunei]
MQHQLNSKQIYALKQGYVCVMDPLFQAIFSEKFNCVRELIASGSEVDIISDSEWTPLHAAVSVNRLDMVNFLIQQRNAPINYRCCEGRTCLLLACESEEIDTKIIECILNAGADVNLGNNDGITPLHAACRNGNVTVVEILIKHRADTNIQEFNGYTPLHCIALSNSVEALQLLLNTNRTDINVTDFDGCTALMLAVDVANCDVAIELLKSGADVNVIGRQTTALHLAVVTQQQHLFKQLWAKTDFNIVTTLADCNNLVKQMVKYGWFFPDRIEVMFQVLDHPDVRLILGEKVKILQTFFYRIRFVKNVQEINICEVLRKFLQIGVHVNQNDLRAFIQFFYKYQNRYEMLDILIHDGGANFDNKDLILFAVDLFPNWVPTLLSFCIRVKPLDIFQHFAETLRINKYMLRLLVLIQYLCTPSAGLKRRCSIHIMTFSLSGSIPDMEADTDMLDIYNYVINVLQAPGVPTLKELSRDEVRRHLSQFCRNSYQYLDLLKHLHLPKDIIDLIQCKMAVKLL